MAHTVSTMRWLTGVAMPARLPRATTSPFKKSIAGVRPRSIEFWYAGDSRLHERWLYEGDPVAGGWTKRMLYP